MESDLIDLPQIISSSRKIVDVNNNSVNGETQFTDVYNKNDGNYVFLAPDNDYAVVTATSSQNGGRNFHYVFVGWKIADHVFSPGDTVSYDELKRLAGSNSRLNAKSVWTVFDDNQRITSANFFINLKCEVRDNLSSNDTSAGSDTWTDPVFTTTVDGTSGIGSSSLGDNFHVTPNQTASNASEIDSQIRKLSTVPIVPDKTITGANYSGPGLTVADFPTDEQVFSQIRANAEQIVLDGKVVKTKYLNSSNFTIRWTLFQFYKTDGWHIDGVLVAKEATFNVTKTFEGDVNAINSVKSNYADANGFDESNDFYISVSHTTSDSKVYEDYKLLTIPDSSVDHTNSKNNYLGYDSYDEASGKYTWKVVGRQQTQYVFSEKNCSASLGGAGEKWQCSAWYSIKNSKNNSDTSGWVSFNPEEGGDVSAVGCAYATNVPESSHQTIAFRNLYVREGTLIINKQDISTNESIAGVKFKISDLSDGGGGTLSLYHRIGTVYYTTDTEAIKYPDEFEKVDGNTVATDLNGFIFLEVSATTDSNKTVANYQLKEDKSSAVGYIGANSVSISFNKNSGITGNVSYSGDESGITWAKKYDKNNYEVDIFNKCGKLLNVSALKQWDDAVVDKKQVTVELWRTYLENGKETSEKVPDVVNSSSASYTKTLTSDSDWCTTWEALPQYINNSEVKYSLREIWIGDPSNSDSAHFNYDEDSVDGYKDYIVTSEDAIYCNSNTTPEIAGKTKDELSSVFSHDTAYWDDGIGSTTFANNALLVVNNSLAGQDITFVKLDREGQNAKPLKGAEFTLYADSNCENAIETVSSDSEGVVRFKGKGTGTYYFKETKAPSGYSYADNVIYKVLVHGTNPKITKLGDASGELVTSVVNSYGAGIKITKLGGGTRGLANAKFKVTKDVESNGSITTQEVSDIVTDKDGVAWILGVVQGTYHVTEVVAPEGYVLPVNPTFTFTVETNEIGETTIVHDALDESGTFVDWEKESNSDDVASGSNGETYKLTVRNKALFSLPTSGGIGIAWVYIAGIALLALACKLYVRRCE